MKILQPRVLRTRQYTGEEPGAYLAEWLNSDLPASKRSPRAREGRTRILELLATIRAVIESGGFSRALTSRPSDSIKPLELVNRQLKRYSVHPVLVWIGDQHGKGASLDFGWEKSGQAKFNPVEEWQALQAIIELGEQGLLDRVRKCKNQKCARWFFARMKDHECCRGQCRINLYRSSPVFRAEWAKYMRRYRREAGLSGR